jgi:hypothetical protein
MGFRVREVEPTPNPNAMKFVLDRSISAEPISLADANAAKGHAVAERLFQIDGVIRLLLLRDFVTVSKTPESRWTTIRPRVIKALAAD